MANQLALIGLLLLSGGGERTPSSAGAEITRSAACACPAMVLRVRGGAAATVDRAESALSRQLRTPSPDSSVEARSERRGGQRRGTAGHGSSAPPLTPQTPRTPRTPRTPKRWSSSLRRRPSGALPSPARDAAAPGRSGDTDSGGPIGAPGIWDECERTFPEYAVAYDECLTQEDFIDQQVQLAAEYGNMTALNFWIEQGGDVNSVDSRGYTALHWASCNGFSEVVDKLLERGANPRARTNQGRTAIEMAKAWGEASERGPLLPEFEAIVRSISLALTRVKATGDDMQQMPAEEVHAAVYLALQDYIYVYIYIVSVCVRVCLCVRVCVCACVRVCVCACVCA